MSQNKTRGNVSQIIALLLKYIPQLIALLKQQAPKAMEAHEIPQIKPEKVSFKLTRKQFRVDGIFSELSDSKGNIVAYTLEHSYGNAPKITNGVWKCVRGPHRLHNMTEDFITFEITGILGHKDLLFHWGNYNKDSEGCVLMGESDLMNAGVEMITNSKTTFGKWMTSLDGIDEFELTVS
jgi:hypothetical protein